MKHKSRIIVAACFAVVAFVPVSMPAAGKKKSDASSSPTATASAAKSNARPLVFHGMAMSADQKAKTFTIAGKEKPRVFKVTGNTTITKAGNSATLADIVPNTEISGSYWQRGDGSLEAKAVKLGPVREKKKESTGSASPADSPKS